MNVKPKSFIRHKYLFKILMSFKEKKNIKHLKKMKLKKYVYFNMLRNDKTYSLYNFQY